MTNLEIALTFRPRSDDGGKALYYVRARGIAEVERRARRCRRGTGNQGDYGTRIAELYGEISQYHRRVRPLAR